MPKKIPHRLSFGNNPSVPFHRFPVHLSDDPAYTIYESNVLCRVWSFENSRPPLLCYMSYDQWAVFLRCHRRQAIRIMNGLVDKELVAKESRGLQTNIWRLAPHLHFPQSTSDSQSPLEVTSDSQSPLLVTNSHYASDTQSLLLVTHSHPRRSLEDQKEDHKEDHIPESLLSQDDPGTPPKKNEALKLDPVFKDSLTPEEPLLEKLEPQVGEAPPIPGPPPEARKPKKPDLTIDAVDALEVPDEVKAAAKRWFGHKQAIRSPIKIRKLLSEITKYGLGLPLVVQRSISSNWDGLWPIKYQDLDEVADEAVNKLFICMSEDGDWVEAGRSNSLLKDSLEEFMGANGVADKEEFKARSEGNGRTFILKDIKRIYIRKLKQTLYTN